MERKMKRVLIITPSLDPKDNISGISTITNLVVEKNNKYQYVPFIVGKKDNDKRGFLWLLNLLITPFRLLFFEVNNIDIVHFNLGFEPKSLIRDSFLLRIITLRSLPLILHIHGGRFMNRTSRGLYKRIINLFLNKAKKIIVLSDGARDFLLQNNPWLDKDKIVVIPNSIVLPDYKISEKDYSSVLSILYLGRIDKAKGLSKIAESLTVLKNKGIPFHFNLCGVGPDKEWFLSLLSSDIKSGIHDMGLVFGEKKDELLKASHLFLLPSDFEGLPLALLESMGNYVVPVVSPVGSIPDVVNKENGRLVTSVNEIVEALEELNNNRTLLTSLAQKSHEMVENKYSVDKFVEQINQVNENLLI